MIQSADPHYQPFVTFNFYSDGPYTQPGSDLAMAVSFLKEMKAFADSIGATMAFPSPDVYAAGDAALASYAFTNLSQTFHNAATCSMSVTAANGVVDGTLHVHGVKNLMVASTAALPIISDANTAYSARLVGLEAARIILGN
jgi:choline dehydrogenase